MAVDIPEFTALTSLHKKRIRIVGAIIAGYTERDALQSAFVGFRGFRSALFVGSDFLLECFVHFFRHTFSVPDGISAANRSLPCSQFSIPAHRQNGPVLSLHLVYKG